MITEKDLQEAIAECLGKRNPDASTCIKLAAFYTIQHELYGSKIEPAYSFSTGNTTENIIEYDSGTEFSQMVNGRYVEDVMPVIDDLMDATQVVNPPLYNAVIRKLTDL